jgi:hypothetical protein
MVGAVFLARLGLELKVSRLLGRHSAA